MKSGDSMDALTEMYAARLNRLTELRADIASGAVIISMTGDARGLSDISGKLAKYVDEALSSEALLCKLAIHK